MVIRKAYINTMMKISKTIAIERQAPRFDATWRSYVSTDSCLICSTFFWRLPLVEGKPSISRQFDDCF